MSLTFWGIVASLVFTCVILLVKYFYTGYVNDNPVEEKLEEVIKTTTGISMDLTPDLIPNSSKPTEPAVSSTTKVDTQS